MASAATESESPWAIVLSGGEGERTRAFVENWLGYHKPKQYCNFVGRRSMFQHTVDRADRLASGERRLTVIARAHRDEVFRQLEGRRRGTVLLQPRNRGTAAGIFLPLTYLRARAPDVAVTIFPSDHFVCPEQSFIAAVARATALIETMPDRIVLQGVEPEGPESDYGWIELGPECGPAREVREFIEKPSPAEAIRARSRGALWNTLVVTGRVDTFWKMGWRAFPDVMELLERWSRSVGGTNETTELERIYRVMPVRDFSSDLLARCCSELLVLPLDGVVWSDWGRPERIIDTLRSIGRKPAFRREHDDSKSPGDATWEMEVNHEGEKIQAYEEAHREIAARCGLG
ncbi:MAG: hypothetical protein BMS9Abin37_0526 [Acidobacteriota bacterium]|nr:MAG: hypothetical protein BMS9Abin37_0526 [Acidobacteriota bacterium]